MQNKSENQHWMTDDGYESPREFLNKPRYSVQNSLSSRIVKQCKPRVNSSNDRSVGKQDLKNTYYMPPPRPAKY